MRDIVEAIAFLGSFAVAVTALVLHLLGPA